jgi:hypothetical protein
VLLLRLLVVVLLLRLLVVVLLLRLLVVVLLSLRLHQNPLRNVWLIVGQPRYSSP